MRVMIGRTRSCVVFLGAGERAETPAPTAGRGPENDGFHGAVGARIGVVFDRSARWYDAFYSHVDYQAEAQQLTAIIRALKPDAASLLDVACGTGRHLEWLCREFECAGTDIEPQMLALAGQALPGVPLEQADMVELNLGGKFDAVTCLFSSIGYSLLPDRLDKAVRAMARHLHPGGVLVVESWITPDAWIGDGSDTVDVVELSIGKLVRVISSRREGDETVLRMHYVQAADGLITTEDERHRLGLFSRDRYLEGFTSARAFRDMARPRSARPRTSRRPSSHRLAQDVGAAPDESAPYGTRGAARCASGRRRHCHSGATFGARCRPADRRL